jgi:hypothetical protein
MFAGMEDPWQERPFLLRFTEAPTRREAYETLLSRIGAL